MMSERWYRAFGQPQYGTAISWQQAKQESCEHGQIATYNAATQLYECKDREYSSAGPAVRCVDGSIGSIATCAQRGGVDPGRATSPEPQPAPNLPVIIGVTAVGTLLLSRWLFRE